MQMDMFAPAPYGLYLPEERTPRIVTGSGLKARPYQEEAFTGVRTQLRDNRSTLLVLPTGSGKTFIFSRIAHDWPERDYAQELSHRVLVLAHRDELLQQARQRIAKETGELVGLEQAEARAGLERIVVGSVQTLCQPDRLGGWKPDAFGLVICDEAHHGYPECEVCRGAERPCAKCAPNTPSPVIIDPGVTGLPHLCQTPGCAMGEYKDAPICATCERVNCDADATGKCPISGEEADDGYNTVAPGDHLL